MCWEDSSLLFLNSYRKMDLGLIWVFHFDILQLDYTLRTGNSGD